MIMKQKKMYKALFLGGCILGALVCGSSALAEEKTPAIPYEEYPRIDGSLACVPLMEALAVKITGCSQIEAEETLSDFSNTNPCYLHLAKGERDILLAYEPADETKQEIAHYAPLTMEPVGRDGLVFIVNKDNPVESLTTQQIYDIYTGRITNWKEVGGNDQPIKAFSRPETSGSQTLMRKLLLKDAEMIEGVTERIESMEGIINRLLDYDNSANAIGYSVYYYASAMYDQPALKFLAVDGVEPSTDSIRTKEYPLLNDFYVVTNEQSCEEALKIRDWLLSVEGQDFVEENGYVPAK